MKNKKISQYNSIFVSDEIELQDGSIRTFTTSQGDKMIIPSSFILLVDDKVDNSNFSIYDNSPHDRYELFPYLDNYLYSLNRFNNGYLKFVNKFPYLGDLFNGKTIWQNRDINTGALSNRNNLWPFIVMNSLYVLLTVRNGFIESFSFEFIEYANENGDLESNIVLSSDSALMERMPYEDQYIKLSHIVIDLP